jgi:hypothetical protein
LYVSRATDENFAPWNEYLRMCMNSIQEQFFYPWHS